MRRRTKESGITLIDVVVSSALLLLIFMGVAAAFQLTIDVVLNNKARAGAITLAGERIEFIRSLSYSQVGTSGGIPAGSLAQLESIPLNGVTFSRRTYIEYADDPLDGLAGADANGIIADYKAVKVEVAWNVRDIERKVTLVSRFSPPGGLETTVTGGTLTINTVSDSGQPVSNAEITIVNTNLTPNINLLTYTNASGTASLIGSPAGSGYRITVTKPGYSTAQTYTPTAQNTSPNPGHLTVSNNQTTTGTFSIDILGSKTINTYTQIASSTWSDPFNDTSHIATSSGITVSGGAASLSDVGAPGTLRSNALAPANLVYWRAFGWSDSEPSGTNILYRIYDGVSDTLIPDAELPGNSAGFTSGNSINLTTISTTTHPSLKVGATLTSSTASNPSLSMWSIRYDSGGSPLQNIAFTLRGAKSIGSGPSGTVYKYDQSHTTNSSAVFAIPSIEADSYTILVNGTSTNYDISGSCAPQPETLSAGSAGVSRIFLAPHTVNSLLVDVRASSTGATIPHAEVGLYRTGFAATSTTDMCGNAFFGGLSSASTYWVTVMRTGYQSTTVTGITVGGASRSSITVQ